jgi:hypothetical protein
MDSAQNFEKNWLIFWRKMAPKLLEFTYCEMGVWRADRKRGDWFWGNFLLFVLDMVCKF